MEDLVKALVAECLAWQEKYLNLEADVKVLALMSTGQAGSMFVSDDCFVDIIAKNIMKMRDSQNIKSE